MLLVLLCAWRLYQINGLSESSELFVFIEALQNTLPVLASTIQDMTVHDVTHVRQHVKVMFKTLNALKILTFFTQNTGIGFQIHRVNLMLSSREYCLKGFHKTWRVENMANWQTQNDEVSQCNDRRIENNPTFRKLRNSC